MNQAINQEKLLYTKRDCAQMLSMCVRTIDNLITSKQLPIRRIGRRVLVHRDVLFQFAKHQIKPKSSEVVQ